MTLLTYATASDIARWADSRRAQEQLPELVRRLILSSGADVRRIDVPAGQGIQLPGFDGMVEAATATPFVPAGLSAWEIGADKEIRGKAEYEYTKRSTGPSEVDRAQTSFVFVTPRVWRGKGAWIREKRQAGVWADVRVIDAHGLETWLQSAVGVHVWLSMALGIHPAGAEDLGTVWLDWSEVTRPALIPALLIAGRDVAAGEVREWLHGTSSPTLTLDAGSREEAVAFFASVVLSQPEPDRGRDLARIIVVRDETAWSQLSRSESALVLIPTFAAGALVTRAVREGHRVVVALDADDARQAGRLVVPRVSRQAADAALQEMGIPEDRSRELAGLARRSLLSLRRRLATSVALKQPSWARPGAAPELIGVFLAGGWKDTLAADRRAIEDLTGVPWDQLAPRLLQWVGDGDPPLRRVGDVWYVIAPEDLWALLSPAVLRDHLDRFRQVVLQVLGTPDPAFDLPSSERWAASLHGREPESSPLLRRSLAQSLAILGTLGADVAVSPGRSGADVAGRTVRELLEAAQSDWKRWASVAHLLPLMAEAAPDAVMDAVEEGLRGDEPILKLFTDHEADSWHSVSSQHTGLLWALETMAWSAELLGRVAALLATLATRDPGGRLANRPRASLETIFVGWNPQTSANLSRRLEVIDRLRRTQGDVAWKLMISLLPDWHGSMSPTARPRWRDWLPDRPRGVMAPDYGQCVSAVMSRLLEDVTTTGSRWKELLEAADHVSPDDHGTVLKRLSELAPASLSPEDRESIWSGLRSKVARHRQFPEADWALPVETVDAMAELYPRFAPDDPLTAHAWLFSPRPDLTDEREEDWGTFRQAVDRAREEATRTVFAKLGADGLLTLATKVEQPGELGLAIGRSGVLSSPDDELAFLLDGLGSPDEKRRLLARGVVAGTAGVKGREWAEALVSHFDARWSADARSELLVMLPSDKRTWSLLPKMETDVVERYWRDLNVYRIDDADVEFVVRQMLDHGRPAAAIDLLEHYTEVVERSAWLGLATQALERLPEREGALAGERVSSYEIGNVLKALGEAALAGDMDGGRVLRLEITYLPIFDHGGGTPVMLFDALGKSPALFVEAVTLVYRAEGEPKRDLSKQESLAAERAHELLELWHRVPGLRPDGTADGTVLMDWVVAARAELAAAGRASTGDQMIGRMLAGSPPGADGAWPAPAVRDVVEQVASDHVDRGLHMGAFNGRGVTSRGPYAGGTQERALADRYEEQAQIVAGQWPRTAALLRGLADTYRRWAAREDMDAEIDHDLES